MAKDVQLNWNPITTRTDGEAVDPATVTYRVDIRQEGIADWTEHSTSPDSNRLVPNLETGIWHFRVTGLDFNNVPGLEAEVQADIPAAPLSAVTNLTATVQ